MTKPISSQSEGSPLTPVQPQKKPFEQEINATAQQVLQKKTQEQAYLPLAVTTAPKKEESVGQVATKILSSVRLEKLKLVRERFEKARAELEKTIPKACGAYVRVVLPEHIEELIGKMEFCGGITGSGTGKEVVNDATFANLASSGKTLTCLLAATLEEAGILRFSDSIARYFPLEAMKKFQLHCNGLAINPASITIGMLSSMTAGLTEDENAGVEVPLEKRGRLSHDEILRKQTRDNSIPFLSRPGDGIYTYSNLQLKFLGYAIEKAYKEKALKGLPEKQRTLGSLLEKAPGRLDFQTVPDTIKNMTLAEFEKIASDPHRQEALLYGVYIHDIIDSLLGHEAAFEEILKTEFLEPLGIKEATYNLPEEVSQQGRALASGTQEALAAGKGVVPLPDNSRNGCGGTFFMTPRDETVLLRALMAPDIRTQDGRLLVSEKRFSALFSKSSPDLPNVNMPSVTSGGAFIENRAASVSIGKGGDYSPCQHFFRWQRMKNPLEHNDAFAVFIWYNFSQDAKAREFKECFRALEKELLSTLQPSPPHHEEPSLQSKGLQLTYPEGRDLVPRAKMYFRGDEGLMAYSSEDKFLYGAGTAFRIHTHEKKEYIFIDDQPELIQIFESHDKKMHYLQVGDRGQAGEIPAEAVVEAAKTDAARRDIEDAKKLFGQLQGAYEGPPNTFHGTFRKDGKDNFCFYPDPNKPGLPYQLISVARDAEKNIDEINLIFPCDSSKVMQFVRNKEDPHKWDMNIVGFFTGTVHLQCKKTAEFFQKSPLQQS